MNDSIKTPVAVRRLGTTYWRLIGLIRYGKIAPPGKDSSGDYQWANSDLEVARSALGATRTRRTTEQPEA